MGPRRAGHLFPAQVVQSFRGHIEVTVRISHQTRAWFKGPWRLGERAWSATFLVLGGSRRGDGDVGFGVEGAELVQEAAGTAVGVRLFVVPAAGRGGGTRLVGAQVGPGGG